MLRHVKPSSPDEEKDIKNLEKDMMRRQAQLTQAWLLFMLPFSLFQCVLEMSWSKQPMSFDISLQLDGNLPKESGKYLKVILGNINVSILDKAAKYDYKDEYERFKLIVNLVGKLRYFCSISFTHFFIAALALAIFCLYMSSRLFDLIFIFLTVWYYCTLTIRESILKVNGSRIKVRSCLHPIHIIFNAIWVLMGLKLQVHMPPLIWRGPSCLWNAVDKLRF